MMIIICLLLFMTLFGVWPDGAIGLLSLVWWLFVTAVVLGVVAVAGVMLFG